MNNLNSVLIEGKVIAPVIMTNKLSDEMQRIPKNLNFKIESYRFYSKSNEAKPTSEIVTAEIEVYGRLSEAVYECISIGKSVRVVGRLKNNKDGLIIVADHVEIK